MQPMWVGIALFVLVDAIVVYVVLKKAMQKRVGSGAGGLASMTGFAGTAAEESKAYLAANYGGETAMLPAALQGLVDRLGARAQEQGVTFDRESLKQLAASAVVSLKAAHPSDVLEALRSVR